MPGQRNQERQFRAVAFRQSQRGVVGGHRQSAQAPVCSHAVGHVQDVGAAINELETVAGRQTDGVVSTVPQSALTWMIPAARARRASAALILAPQSSPGIRRRNADRPDVSRSPSFARPQPAGRGTEPRISLGRCRWRGETEPFIAQNTRCVTANLDVFESYHHGTDSRRPRMDGAQTPLFAGIFIVESDWI